VITRINKKQTRVLLLVFILFAFQTGLFAKDAKFRQLSEDDGLDCMEAENYSGMRESGTDSYWELVEEPLDFSGTGAMQAFPEGYEEHKDITHGQENAPVLEYAAEFVKTEQLYVRARASHVDGYDDSVWFGLDELIEGTDPLSYTTDEQSYANEWYWIRYLMNEEIAVLQVPSTGVHVFELYMREPSFRVDKIVLTTNQDYLPDDVDTFGPPETLTDTEVNWSGHEFAKEISLAQNYPNPFNPATPIDFSVPSKSTVTINIFNTLGDRIKTLVSETMNAGAHSVVWNATDDGNTAVAAGIYYYSIRTNDFNQVRKMLYIK